MALVSTRQVVQPPGSAYGGSNAALWTLEVEEEVCRMAATGVFLSFTLKF